MSTTEQTLNDALAKNGYRMEQSGTQITFHMRGGLGLTSMLFSIASGVLLIWVTLWAHLHFTIFLLGMLLVGLSLTRERWRFPRQIIVDQGDKLLTLRYGVLHHVLIPFDEITGLNVDEDILSADANPFRETSEDYVYRYELMQGTKRVKLLRLVFERPHDEVNQQLFLFLKKLLEL